MAGRIRYVRTLAILQILAGCIERYDPPMKERNTNFMVYWGRHTVRTSFLK